MEVTQGIVLPVLLAAIIANTVILILVVVASRMGRRDRITDTRSALQGGLLSTSFVDRSAASDWTSNGRSGADPDAADEGSGESGDHAAVAEASSDDADPAAATEAASDAPGADDADDDEDAIVATGKDGVDPLTGLIDSPTFHRLVAAEDVRMQRYHRPATVVMFELGGLERMVDRLGSDAADRVMPALADTMRRLARDVDFVARLGPGRFGVLLPETDEIAAINYVERVRRACELWLESGAIALTLAVGWAGSTGDPTLTDAMRLATDRMYVELRREVRKTADY